MSTSEGETDYCSSVCQSRLFGPKRRSRNIPVCDVSAHTPAGDTNRIRELEAALHRGQSQGDHEAAEYRAILDSHVGLLCAKLLPVINYTVSL
jgi:hypothetical protein